MIRDLLLDEQHSRKMDPKRLGPRIQEEVDQQRQELQRQAIKAELIVEVTNSVINQAHEFWWAEGWKSAHKPLTEQAVTQNIVFQSYAFSFIYFSIYASGTVGRSWSFAIGPLGNGLLKSFCRILVSERSSFVLNTNLPNAPPFSRSLIVKKVL